VLPGNPPLILGEAGAAVQGSLVLDDVEAVGQVVGLAGRREPLAGVAGDQD